ncbi:MAG: pirin family protein [Candidatus Heimdallarchaeota archaeon]|nr:pirin family protein [Candidatus Heimdallarchaeota archaeon]
MSIRPVKRLIKAKPTIEGAGVHLRRAFGFGDPSEFDPFLLLDDFRNERPEDYLAGFPWHPHRGMETVTYMLHGKIRHEDSLGNKGELRSGDIQWMTAGSGIIHQEMPMQKDGLMRGFQLWVNLPSESKMMQPRYQDITIADVPEVKIDNQATVKVLAGTFKDAHGPVTDVVSKPTYLDIQVEQETEFIYDLPTNDTSMVYVIGGNGYFDGQKKKLVLDDHLVVFGKGEQIKVTTAKEPVRFLLMSGTPINEPVAWHGPIVMNTREELVNAYDELNKGSFIKHEYKV